MIQKGFLVLSMVFFIACHTGAQQPVNLNADAFEQAIGQPCIQVLDVRTMAEYQSGHLKDALLADWNQKEEFKRRAAALDKSKPVYTYCLSGGRSAAAAAWLKENGFTVYNMEGGISAWKRANKPVEGVKEVKQMSMDGYNALIPADKTVLVDVGATWCPPCKKMKPVVDSLVRNHQHQFVLIEIDGGEQTQLSKDLKVDALPTFIIYKNGKEVWRKSGMMDASELAAQL